MQSVLDFAEILTDWALSPSFGLKKVHLLCRYVPAQLVRCARLNEFRRDFSRKNSRNTINIQELSNCATNSIMILQNIWHHPLCNNLMDHTNQRPFNVLKGTDLIDMSCSKPKPNVTCPTLVVGQRHPKPSLSGSIPNGRNKSTSHTHIYIFFGIYMDGNTQPW